MNRKKKMLQVLTLYFMEKGKILSISEYKAQSDTPYKANQIATIMTSWSLLPRLIKANFPVEYDIIMNSKQEPAKPVVPPAKKAEKPVPKLTKKELQKK